MKLNNILHKISTYENLISNLEVYSYIKKENGKYKVLSKNNKNLGSFKTKEEAKKRLQQIEYFKHQDKNEVKDKKIDLTNLENLSYSFIMRELNKVTSREVVLQFCKIFKDNFDNAINKELQSPEQVALQNTLVEFNKIFPIKLSKELTKNAAISELGNANLVGKYLSDIIKFILNRAPTEKKNLYLNKVKNKINQLNENDLANKHMPVSASIGQSITFVKHVLFNQKPQYIKSVLNEIVSNL